MNEQQRQKINDLARCTFLPASFQKRFARDMASRPDEYVLTEKQAAYLDMLHHLFRAQIHGYQAQGYETWFTKYGGEKR